ncbi:Polyadenylate-binding protein 4 [Bulinus truncatus]|nr:Polyadenylate-binding protein 4 [Bulinus truncatus]
MVRVLLLLQACIISVAVATDYRKSSIDAAEKDQCRVLTLTYAVMASVFVEDLPSDVTEKDLYEKFAQLGNVLSVKVCQDDDCEKSLCYGYVLYQDPDTAEKAVEKFHNDVIHDQPIGVLPSDNPSHGYIMEGNVFVKNLDRSVDSSILYKAFSPYGKIVSCKVHHRKKGSKCHGFVQFESELAANSAINNMNGSVFFGKKLYVGQFLNRDQREPHIDNQPSIGHSSSSLRTVYIKNLGPCVDSVFLKITCSPYGEVSNVKIIRDSDGTSKGFAFVTFKKVEEAVKAIEMLNGKEIDGRVLFAGPAIKKSGRKNQHFQQRQQQQIFTSDTSDAGQETFDKPQATSSSAPQENLCLDSTRKTNMLPAMSLQRHPPPEQYYENAPQISFTPNVALQLPSLRVSIQPENFDANFLTTLPQISQLNAVVYQPRISELTPKAPKVASLSSEVQDDTQIQYECDQPQLHQQFNQQLLLQPVHNTSAVCKLQDIQHQTAADSSVGVTATQGVNLYVKHLDDDVDDATLKGMFSKFGEVISAKVMMEGEKSRGFGFVCFARAEDAARATRDMRRRVDDVNRKPLYVAPAQRKEERQAFFREKLKSRQNELHQCDVETVRKCLTMLEDTKEMFAPCPCGDNQTSIRVPSKAASQNEQLESKAPNSFWAGQHCDGLGHACYHSNKFHGVHHSPQKRSNFYNFECFNVENLRTPLIKPTRLSNMTDEKSLTDPSTWNPFRLNSEKSPVYGPTVFLSSINTFLSSKPLDNSKPHGEITGSRKPQNSIWTYNNSENMKLSGSEEGVKALGPIGFKPNRTDSIPSKTIEENIRPNQNLDLRTRSFSKLAPIPLDSRKSEGKDISAHQQETKFCLLENVFYFSGSSESNPDDFIVKKFIPDGEPAGISKSSPLPTASDEITRTLIPDDFLSSRKVSGCTDPDLHLAPRTQSYPVKHCTSESEALLSPLGCMRFKAASFSEDFIVRRTSSHLKERSDSVCDSDDDDCCRIKSRSMERNEDCFNVDVPDGPVDLSKMSAWPVEQQKMTLADPLKAKLVQVLAKMLSAPDNVQLWNQDLTPTIQELLRQQWQLNSLGERLLNMMLEMDVGDILNILQSRDHLVYMVSEGLKQIENFDKAITYLTHVENSSEVDNRLLATISENNPKIVNNLMSLSLRHTNVKK